MIDFKDLPNLNEVLPVADPIKFVCECGELINLGAITTDNRIKIDNIAVELGTNRRTMIIKHIREYGYYGDCLKCRKHINLDLRIE